MTAMSIIVALLVVKAVLTVVLAFWHRRVQHQRAEQVNSQPQLGVTVLIAAYNEEVGIADTLRSVLAQDVSPLQVLVVDDGSSDRTSKIVRDFALRDPRVTLIQQANGGKARALNNAIQHITQPVAVSVDADSALAPGTLAQLARHFHDPKVGAVAGDVRVAGPATFLSQFQYLEYTVGQHMEKRAQDVLGAVTVVPGAAGAYRTILLQEVGGYSHDTLTEDMDLTVAIAAKGYQVRFEPQAISYTEPPNDIRSLWRQRMRWMYGTFQVMGKYRNLMFNARAGRLGLLALPYVALYGLTLGGAGPLFDLVALAMLLHHSAQDVVMPVLLNLAADFAVVAMALKLGGLSLKGILLTPAQRLFLRPFVSLVVLMTCFSFLRRKDIHWNKLPRMGLHMPNASLAAIPVEVASPAAGD